MAPAKEEETFSDDDNIHDITGDNDEELKKALAEEPSAKQEDLLLFEDTEELNEEQQKLVRIKELAGERSIFARKASESQYSEELEFH